MKNKKHLLLITSIFLTLFLTISCENEDANLDTSSAGQPTIVTTLPEQSNNGISVSLELSITPKGLATMVDIECGLTESYDSTIQVQHQYNFSYYFNGNTEIKAYASLQGLQENTTYHYRIKSTNELGVFYTQDYTFTTSFYKEMNESQITEVLKEFLDYGGWWYCQELTTDEMVVPTRNTDWDDNGKWRALQLHTWENNQEHTNALWERLYRGVANSDLKIYHLFNNDSTNLPAKAKTDYAKCLTMKSFFYWQLIDNYGDVPVTPPFTSIYIDYGKPYKNKRASIYNKIVKDLLWSIPNLRKGSENYSVNEAMAQMTLARLYLNSKVYVGVDNSSKAIPILEELIESGVYSLASNVKDPFKENNSACSENIFTIQFNGDETTMARPEFNLH